MIIRNTRANSTFTRKVREAVNAEPGFRLTTDPSWNCGEDIRIEIGTVNAPFIVITKLTTEDFDLHIRMTKTELDIIEIEEMKFLMASVEKIASRLYQLVEEYKPALSRFSA